jgi:hypothetical protein
MTSKTTPAASAGIPTAYIVGALIAAGLVYLLWRQMTPAAAPAARTETPLGAMQGFGGS